MARVNPEQRKAAIVAATFERIARDGIEGATIRQVATAAGATTGRVTHYFTSRADLLVATLCEVEHRRMKRIATHVDLEPAARLKATLLELLPLDSARLDEQRVWMSLCTTGIPEIRDEIHRQTIERDRLVGTLVETAFGRSTNDTEAHDLVALVDGLSQRLMLDSTTRPRQAAHRAVDRALNSAAVDA